MPRKRKQEEIEEEEPKKLSKAEKIRRAQEFIEKQGNKRTRVASPTRRAKPAPKPKAAVAKASPKKAPKSPPAAAKSTTRASKAAATRATRSSAKKPDAPTPKRTTRASRRASREDSDAEDEKPPARSSSKRSTRKKVDEDNSTEEGDYYSDSSSDNDDFPADFSQDERQLLTDIRRKAREQADREVEERQRAKYPPLPRPPPPKPCCSALCGVSFVAILSVLVARFWGPDLSTPVPVPCYVDTYVSESPATIVEQCIGVADADRVPCPGICQDGVLTECVSGHLEVDGHLCVRNEAANATVQAMDDLLTKWTYAYLCGNNPYVVREGPMFHYSQLAGELELGYDLGLVQASEDKFVAELVGKDVLIGLKDLPKTSLWCKFKRVFWTLFGVVIVTTWSIAHYLILWYMECLEADFWMTIIVSVISGGTFFSMRWASTRHENRRRLMMDVANLRNAVCVHLAKLNKAALEEHVRDDMRSRCATEAERNRLVKVLWPRVQQDLVSDTRIHQSVTTVNGKVKTVWQWIATEPTEHAVHFQDEQ